MRLADFENRTMDELLRGYYWQKEEKQFCCLECGFCCAAEKEMRGHWNETHRGDEETRFLRLLNADSVLALSPLQKSVYYRFFLGQDNKQICDELSLTGSTVSTLRGKLEAELVKAKITILMTDMLFGRGFAFRQYSKKETPPDRIPGLDPDTGTVIGWFNKDQLHDVQAPIPHTTVLILVAKRDAKGGWRFLVANKAGKAITLSGDAAKTGWVKLDCLGGHTQANDSDAVSSSQPLPDDLYIGAARRELDEELRVKNGEVCPDKLVYWYETQYEGPTYPVGWNIETTAVYLYILPENVADNRVLVRDEYVDALGEKVKVYYPAKFMSLPELLELPETDFMDGMGRIVRDLSDEKLERQLFDLLEQNS